MLKMPSYHCMNYNLAKRNKDNEKTSLAYSRSYWPREPLPRYYIYHFNVIYNHAQNFVSKTSDSNLALDVTYHLVQRLEKLGYVNK